MKTVLKSLLLFPTEGKWKAFIQMKKFFQERDKNFDEVMDFIGEFKSSLETFPNIEACKMELTSSNELTLLSYVVGVVEDPAVNVYEEDSVFFAYLRTLQKNLFEIDLHTAVTDFGRKVGTLEEKTIPTLGDATKDLITGLHQVYDRATYSEESISGLVYGEDSLTEFQGYYDKIVEQKNSGDFLYYDFGFSRTKGIKIKPGDLVILGGFTSQGKSVWSRYLAYRMLVEYGLNVLYVSMEMKFEGQLAMFHTLHANNKKLFAGTPKISFTKFKEGSLSPEELDFLMGTAGKDFTQNKSYGSLFLEQPNKPRYRLSDIRTRVAEIEATLMPIHVVVVDYLTLLYPLEKDGSPDKEDYNQMIQEFKTFAVTHRDRQGNIAPLVAITPAQISRGSYETALTENGRYDLSCLRQYSGLEQAADIVCSTLITDAMRQSKQIRWQNLKNRDGAVEVEPVDLYIDMDYGFLPSEIKHRSEQEIIHALKTIRI